MPRRMDAPHAAAHGLDLVPVVALLAAGVLAVPLFKRLGLGSVLGYLAGGLLIGPAGLGVVHDPASVLHAAELGVVLFLFVVGLEMEPRKLWALRRQIFGLGVAQVVACSAALTLVGVASGLPLVVAFVAGTGFVLTSTAIVMQVLAERGETTTPAGERTISILLLEDLAIVPLLALVALLAPAAATAGGPSRLVAVGVAVGAIVAVVVAGRFVLDPMFRVLAAAKAREVLTAAALLVVLGAALLMQVGGLSMAMGAFLAGVLLSTSNFRHQLEADVEPFRGILLGLFFLAVGMSLDLRFVADRWTTIALCVSAFMIVKSLVIYLVARASKSGHDEAVDRAVLMSQGGEFAFVLYTTAASAGILDAPTNALFTATVIVSMALTPLALVARRRWQGRARADMTGVDVAQDLHGDVLLIGFGRFGQIASQGLLARKHKVSIIDDDPDMIRAAATYGFKVYYGDGTRLDILHAAGAHHAAAILVCIDDKVAATKIVQLLRHELPLAKVFVRAFDRAHVLELVKLDVHYQVRELLESALTFGRAALLELGATPDEADAVVADVRERDRKRLEMQMLGDLQAGRDLLVSNAEQAAHEQGVTQTTAVPPATPASDER